MSEVENESSGIVQYETKYGTFPKRIILVLVTSQIFTGLLATFIQVCSIESAIISSRSDEETKNKICLLIDRYDTSLFNDIDGNQTQSLSPNVVLQYFQNIRKEKWFQALKKKYNSEGNQLSLIIPDYAIVFSGMPL